MSANKPSKPIIVEQTFGEKLETWYDRNAKWLTGLVILAFVVVIGWKGYDWVKARNVARANDALAGALQHYQQGVQNPDAAKKVDELNGAVTAAQQVVNDYSDSYIGREAQLLIANAQYTIALQNSGKEVKPLEQALESYQKYLKMAQTSEEKAAANIAIGNVTENLGFIRNDKKTLQEAVAAYEAAAKEADGTYLAGEARLAAARAKTGINDPAAQEDAKKLFAEVEKNRPVQLISDQAQKDAKPLKLQSGQTLSAEEVVSLRNYAAWSQHQEAKDALAQAK